MHLGKQGSVQPFGVTSARCTYCTIISNKKTRTNETYFPFFHATHQSIYQIQVSSSTNHVVQFMSHPSQPHCTIATRTTAITKQKQKQKTSYEYKIYPSRITQDYHTVLHLPARNLASTYSTCTPYSTLRYVRFKIVPAGGPFHCAPCTERVRPYLS